MVVGMSLLGQGFPKRDFSGTQHMGRFGDHLRHFELATPRVLQFVNRGCNLGGKGAILPEAAHDLFATDSKTEFEVSAASVTGWNH